MSHPLEPGAPRIAPARPDGLIVVDKPPGMTSHDVVARVRRLLGVKRVGHGGTLDPAATGVLLVGVGRATRLLTFLLELPKTYRATMRLGVTTTTLDGDGEVVLRRPCRAGGEDVARILASFEGRGQQVPPMVSAVKVGGEPLYRKARRGEVVERAARAIEIYCCRMESFAAGDEPEATFLVRCSKGTYVRAIAADAGEALGCGAHLIALRRLAIGPFELERAVDLEALAKLAATSEPIGLSLEEAAGFLPRRDVEDDGVRLVCTGRPLPASGIVGAYGVYGLSGKLLAVYEAAGDSDRPRCVLVSDANL